MNSFKDILFLYKMADKINSLNKLKNAMIRFLSTVIQQYPESSSGSDDDFVNLKSIQPHPHPQQPIFSPPPIVETLELLRI